MNPIEGVWRILKQRVKKWKVHNAEELREAIEAEWNAITLEEINELIVGKKKHWQKRCEQVYERNGYATEF